MGGLCETHGLPGEPQSLRDWLTTVSPFLVLLAWGVWELVARALA